MNRFVLSHKNIKDGMCCVADAAACGLGLYLVASEIKRLGRMFGES